MVNLFEKSSIISFVLVPTSIGIIFLTVNILFPSVKTKIYKFFKGIISGILSITKMEHKWKFIFHTIFICLCCTLTSFCKANGILFSKPMTVSERAQTPSEQPTSVTAMMKTNALE